MRIMCVMYQPFDTYVFVHSVPAGLPWIFQEAPLTFNGAPGNVGGSLVGVYYVCMVLYLKNECMYDQNCK